MTAAPLGWLTPLFALGELLSNPLAHIQELTAWVVKEETLQNPITRNNFSKSKILTELRCF